MLLRYFDYFYLFYFFYTDCGCEKGNVKEPPCDQKNGTCWCKVGFKLWLDLMPKHKYFKNYLNIL